MFVTSEFGKKDCHLYFNSFLFDTDFTLNCELSLFLINMERRVCLCIEPLYLCNAFFFLNCCIFFLLFSFCDGDTGSLLILYIIKEV